MWFLQKHSNEQWWILWKRYAGGDFIFKDENGFVKIHELKPGISPHAYIEMLDAEYPDKVTQ